MTDKKIIDPDDKLDYQFDWAANFLSDSETITEYTVTPTDGITVDSDSETGGVVTVWVSGANRGTVRYPKVTCHIVTNQGRERDWTITFDPMER